MTAHVLHDLFVFLATAYIDELPDYITVFWLTAELILAIFGFYLIRKSKRAEILALWDKKWNRDQKQDWKQAEAEDAKAQEKAARDAVIRERNAFGAGKQGKFGGLTYDQALARQREMQAAEGFNVDLGRWGADGKWGNQSRNEWERYQQWKAGQELAALKAQNAGLQRVLPENKYLLAGSTNNVATVSTPSSRASVTIPTLNRTFVASNIGGPGGTN